MPLQEGSSHETIGNNIRELQDAGHSHDQAVAIALDKAGEGKSMNKTLQAAYQQGYQAGLKADVATAYCFKEFWNGKAVWLNIQDDRAWAVIKRAGYIYEFKLGWLMMNSYLSNFQRDLEAAGLYPDPTWDDVVSDKPEVVFFYE